MNLAKCNEGKQEKTDDENSATATTNAEVSVQARGPLPGRWFGQQ